MKIFTREQAPQQWAATQNNLGLALSSQGERAEGADGVRLLGEAVAAYREALKVYAREQLPQQWATRPCPNIDTGGEFCIASPTRFPFVEPRSVSIEFELVAFPLTIH